MKNKLNNHKLCQMIVKKFVKGKVNWPREIKIAKRLVKKFNSFDFWNNIPELGSPPPSLAWFLKPEGKAFILKQYEDFNLILNKEEVILEKNKIDQDKNICQKPKTLIQFIRYGKKT